jgi:hypothetical protein
MSERAGDRLSDPCGVSGYGDDHSSDVVGAVGQKTLDGTPDIVGRILVVGAHPDDQFAPGVLMPIFKAVGVIFFGLSMRRRKG